MRPLILSRSIDHVMVCAQLLLNCPARNDRNTAAGAVKHDIKRADSAHLLFPPLARVAGLCSPLPLIRVHLWACHSEVSVILVGVAAGVFRFVASIDSLWRNNYRMQDSRSGGRSSRGSKCIGRGLRGWHSSSQDRVLADMF